MKPTFFATPAAFREWLEGHHAREKELLVGYYKKGTGKPSISWPESVDEALCFGWIDGVRRSLSEEAYCIRFTPRKKTSIWSAINVARVAALESLGRMTEAGRRAFAHRTPERSRVYSFERNTAAQFSADEEQRFRANAAAATYFDAQPPWYRRTSTHWVISAKRDITRLRRFEQLLEDCVAGRWILTLARPEAKGSPPRRERPKAPAAAARAAKPSPAEPRAAPSSPAKPRAAKKAAANRSAAKPRAAKKAAAPASPVRKRAGKKR